MSGSFAERAALTSAASSVASGSLRRRASSRYRPEAEAEEFGKRTLNVRL
jgi:hypothetical protein